MFLRYAPLLIALILTPSSKAASIEYQVKAAYLFNFMKFVEWPWTKLNMEPDSPLNIAVLGKDPFEGILSNLKKEKVGKRKIQVEYLSNLENIENYQVIFIASGTDVNVVEALSKTKGKPILTIGESKDFLKIGGMIRLFLKGENVRFSVHLDNAKLSGLYIGSELLNLASDVIKNR